MNKEESLIKAVVNGDTTQVAELVTFEADANIPDKWRDTLLHRAARSGLQKLCLVEKDTDVNARNAHNDTPLDLAIKNNYLNIVEYLLKQEANINSQDQDDYSPLYQAVKHGHPLMVELLVAKGADINEQDTDGKTLLHQAVRYNRPIVVAPLVAKGADVNTPDNEGKTSLHEAAAYGLLDMVRHLVAKGANVNVQDKEGTTPLHAAVANHCSSVVAHLLSQGAYINARNQAGLTPLGVAVFYKKSILILKVLLAYGAYGYIDPDTEDALEDWQLRSFGTQKQIDSGITMLAAGFYFRPGPLTQSLQAPKARIEATVANWLGVLGLSQDLCHEVTPRMLRVLPRVLHWMDKIKKTEPVGFGGDYTTEQLKQVFFIPLHEEKTSRVAILQYLSENPIPPELILLIREYVELSVDRTMVRTLAHFYGLEYRIMDRIWQHCKRYFEIYRAFHQNLFTWSWQEDKPGPRLFSP